MKKAKVFSRLFLILIVMFSSESMSAQKSFRLGHVTNIDGIADSIWLASTKKKDRVDTNAVAWLGYTGMGSININGRDISLKHIGGDLPDKNFKVGRGGYDTWSAKSLKLRLDYVFTWLCPPKDEQCEVYYFKGVLDITYKGVRRKVKVNGFGGS